MKGKELHGEILRLSIPSILANITVPLVGMVDTGIAGHLSGNQAAFIGALSVGAMMFSLIYWSFGFLRTGTGGLTAQAFGRGDSRECARILSRGTGLAAIVSVMILALQFPIMKLVLLVTQATPEVESFAERYFLIRIWAAPATLSLMTMRGWFVGMQNSVDSMWTDLIINVVNIAASLLLTFGLGSWDGLGFDGIPLGTVIAQYSGLLYCILVCRFKYAESVFSKFSRSEVRGLLDRTELGSFFKMNADLLGRSFFFILIYIGYTMIAAKYGDVLLATSSILMQVLMLFSYFTDGFAYAGEALTGRFIGARDSESLRQSIKGVFLWSIAVVAVFMLFYAFAGTPLVRMMTDDPAVREACGVFFLWILVMPPLGCAAFTWDGIFLGATSSKHLRNSMAGAAVSFFAVWYLGQALMHPTDHEAIHLLLGAYFAHLLFRTVYLTACRKSMMMDKQ